MMPSDLFIIPEKALMKKKDSIEDGAPNQINDDKN